MKAIFRYITAAAALFPSAALACNPSALLEGGGGSVNYLSTVGPGSNCFFSSGLLDSTGAAAFPAVAALADATANPTDALLGSLAFGYNGTTWDRLRTAGAGTGILKTDLSTVAGVAALTGGVNGSTGVGGLAASGATASGNPLMVGGVFNTTQPTVTTGQVVDLQATARGAQIVAPGVDNFAVQAAESGTWTVQPGNTPNTSPWLVQAQPGTAGGASTCYLLSTASTNSLNCKASAGQIYMIRVVNTNATLASYLRMYNSAAASPGPTCSSATGFVETIPVPANASSLGGGFMAEQSFGQAYSLGIGFCLTGGGSSTDNTNGQAGVYITILYK